MKFDQLALRTELLKAIKSKGYTTPTPIQAKAIPAILAGQDLLGRAQTGTGKTDAFALPLLEILSRQVGGERNIRALILAPTRELALQVGDTIKSYGRRVSIRCTVVYGGVRAIPQVERLRRGVDVLVATPGRLLDLADQGHVDFSKIEFLVFDEADRMLDLGFSEEISAILNLVPTKRRTMLFSATYSPQIRTLAKKMLYNPEFVEVTTNNSAAEAVTQKVHRVNKTNKFSLLIHLIKKRKWARILVFARTKHGANKLTERLISKGIIAAALHGNKSQSLRTRTLEAFKRGEIHTLVATDVAARGLDVNNLPYVVNYDIPTIPEDYVHRIGRTGRAGVSGIAVSLVCPEENFHLDAIEKLLKHEIPVESVAGFTEDDDVPDYVLLRPTDIKSHKKAKKSIKELINKRNKLKKQLQTKNAKSTTTSKESITEKKLRTGKKKNTAAKKLSRSESRTNKSWKSNKTRGKR